MFDSMKQSLSPVFYIFACNRASGQHRVFVHQTREHWSETVSDSDVEQCVALLIVIFLALRVESI